MKPPANKRDSPEFMRFRTLYPRKREGWAKAREAWLNAVSPNATQILRGAVPVDPQEILAGVERYEFSSDPKFWPMAATWIHERRWEGEPDTSPPTRIVEKRKRTGMDTARYLLGHEDAGEEKS